MAKGQIKQAQAKIDKKTFEDLCHIMCTEQEILYWFGVSKDTLIRWCKETYGTDFENIYAKKKQGGKISLRRYQLQQAEKNPTMAIWLGKQYLGQREMPEADTKSIQKVEELLTALTKEANK